MELPQSANVPLSSSKRLSSLDLVRGCALLGIGLENLFTIHTQNADFAAYASQYSTGLNQGILLGLMVLIRSKFYPIFSFVFGVSAALSLPHQGLAYFIRRSSALFVLGLLQTAFIWNGDVLTQYAIMGLLLLLVKPFPNWVLNTLAGLLLLFSFTGELWDIHLIHGAESTSQYAATVYRKGSFIETTRFRIQSLFQETLTLPSLLFLSRIFAFLLLGYAFGRAGGLENWQRKKWMWQVIIVLAFVAGLTAIWIQVAGWRNEENLTLGTYWIKQILLTGYFFGLVGLYLLLPLLFTLYLPGNRFLQLLGKLGQYTLTHYLIQNLLFSLLFYHYGAGLYGRLAPWQLLSIYFVVIALQLWLSEIWKRKESKGPVEVLLRRWAGKRA